MIVLSFVICHLPLSPLGAQTFTQQLQKQVVGEGVVTIHQDKAIDDLVNGTTAVQRTVTPIKKQTPDDKPLKAKTKELTKEKSLEAKSTKRDEERSRRSEITETTVSETSDTIDAEKRITRTRKTIGYRVQAFAGGNSRRDRQKAEQTGNQLRALFPTEQVYTHFYSPRWICRMGNYRTYEEAHKMLLEVQRLGYSSATVVRGKISVPY